MSTRWPLMVSFTVAVMLSVVILGMPLNTKTTHVEADSAACETSLEDFTVIELEPVKVGNFEVTEATRETVWLHSEPETTETPETTEETTPEPTENSSEDEHLFTCSTEESSLFETSAEPLEKPSPLYKCHGVLLNPDYQAHAYALLCEYGMEDYFPVWICQCFQESSFSEAQVTLNHGHNDCGLMQIRQTYWDEFQRDSGIFGDILDPYTNISVSVWLLSQYHSMYGGSVEETISHYMSGYGGEYMAQYVTDVLSHIEYLERIR